MTTSSKKPVVLGVPAMGEAVFLDALVSSEKRLPKRSEEKQRVSTTAATNGDGDGPTMSLVASAHQRMMMKKKLEKKRAGRGGRGGRGGGGGEGVVSPASASSGLRSQTATTAHSSAAPAAVVASPPPTSSHAPLPPPPPPPPPPPTSPFSRPSVAQRTDRGGGGGGGGEEGGGGTGASLVGGGAGINSLNTSRQWETTPQLAPQQQQQSSPSSLGMLPAYYERVALSPDSDYEKATRPRGKHTNYLGPRDAGRVPNRRRRGYDSFVGAPPKSPLSPSSGERGETTATATTTTTGGAFDTLDDAPSPSTRPIAPAPPVPVLGDNCDFEYHTDRDEDTAFDNDDDDDGEVNGTAAQPRRLDNGFAVDDHNNDEEVITDRVSTDPSEDLWAENDNEVDYHMDGDEVAAFDNDNDDDGEGYGDEQENKETIAPPPPLLGKGFIMDDSDNGDEEVMTNRVLTDPPVDAWANWHSHSPDNDNQTVDSERALVGTPVRKKNKKLLPPTHGHKKTADDGDSMALLVEGKPPKMSEDSGKHRKKMPTLFIIEDDVVLKYSTSRRAKESLQEESNWKGGQGREQDDESPVAHESSVVATVGTKRGSISSRKMHDIAPHVHNSAVATGGSGYDNAPAVEDRHRSRIISSRIVNNSLRNIGLSKSWDSPGVSGFPESDDALASFGMAGKTTTFFSSSFWDDGNDENSTSQSKQQPRKNGEWTRMSKSWDEGRNDEERMVGGFGGVNGAVDDGFGSCGTWGEQTASLFNGIDTAQSGSLFNGIAPNSDDADEIIGTPRGGSDKENDSLVNADEWGEWDKAEVQWRNNISGSDNVAGKTNDDKIGASLPHSITPAITKKSHPWNTDSDLENSELDLSVFGTEGGEEKIRSEKSRSAPSERGGNDVEFGKNDNRRRTKQEKGPSMTTTAKVAASGTGDTKKQSWQQSIPSLIDPEDIFEKINGNLKQADKTKNRVLGKEIESDCSSEPSYVSNDPPPLTTVVQSSSSMSPSSAASHVKDEKKMMGKRIKFVSDEKNTVHTYLKETYDFNYESERTYDDEDEEHDEEHNLRSSQPPTSSITNIGEAATTDNEERSDADTYEDSTIADSITYKSGLSDDVRGEDFGILADLRKDVDDAVTAVAATLGGLFGVAQASKSGNKKNVRSTNDHDGGGVGRGDGGFIVGVSRSEDDKSVITEDNDTYDESRAAQSTAQSTLATGTWTDTMTETEAGNDWLGYMRRIIFPKDDGASVRSTGTKDDDMFDAESTYQEEEDNYLLLQALAAARAIHHVQGVEYDETNEINVLTDIKFAVVTVSLPLGVFFQEHDIGVWVSRAVPSGNGAKQGVQHGDQLAAINGSSSVHTTIDEVASKISSTPNGEVELTFLRYVGPLCPVPGSITQEGFEVTDSSVLPRTDVKESHPKTKRGLFSKKLTKIIESPPRKSGVGIISQSPRRATRSSQYTNPPSQPLPSMPKQGPTAPSMALPPLVTPFEEVPPMPGLSSPSSTTKKKKTLGKLLSFKKKT